MTRRKFGDVPDRFGFLFALLLADIALLIVLPAEGWPRVIQALFIAATLLLALRTSEAAPRVVAFGTFGAGLTVLVATVVAITGHSRADGIVYFLDSFLLLLAIVAVLRAVASASEVTGKMVLGALSSYLMLGLLFAFTYIGLAEVRPDDFFAQGGAHPPSDYVYFSYITLSTTGYGDLTPLDDLPRVLAVIEALTGQIFLVTAVASLVSLWRPRARSD